MNIRPAWKASGPWHPPSAPKGLLLLPKNLKALPVCLSLGQEHISHRLYISTKERNSQKPRDQLRNIHSPDMPNRIGLSDRGSPSQKTRLELLPFSRDIYRTDLINNFKLVYMKQRIFDEIMDAEI